MSIGPVKEYTTYFDLEVPTFDFPGWHTYYERNLKTMDGILYLMTGADSLKGIWKNSKNYDIGDRVVDTVAAEAFECFVQHTSAAPPTTFDQDRNAHPTYWRSVDFIQSLMGTSGSSVTIGLGNKTFTTQSGRVFTPGAKIIINSSANPTVNYMWGSVVTYDGQTLVVDVDVVGGSGTHSDWWISISGERGTQGEVGPIGVQGPQGEIGETGPEGPTGPQGIIEEAPTSGSVYGRRGSDSTWEVVTATSADVLPVVPSGGISSTTVQAALYELDTEKLSKSGGVMTGPLTLAGPSHWTYATPGAGSWYDSNNAADKFFVGTDPTTETFRIYAATAAINALSIDGITGKTTVVHPPSNDYHIATKKYVDERTGDFVDVAGDTMTGGLTLPTLNVEHANNSDIWFKAGGVAKWLTRSEPLPAGDFNFHRYDNAGGYLGSALTIGRLTGDINVARDATINGILRTSASLAMGQSISTGLYGDGGNVAIRGYTGGGIYIQSHAGAANYGIFDSSGLRVTGTVSSSVINATASDGLKIQVPGGNHARIYHHVAGVRVWTAGVWADGHFRITDESAGRVGLTLENNGNLSTGGGIWASSFNGNLNGNASYAHNAGYASSAGSAPFAGGDLTANAITANHGYRSKAGTGGAHRDVWWNIYYATPSSVAPFHNPTVEVWADGTNWGSIINAQVFCDYRIKKDVVDLHNMWDTTKALRPIKYTGAEYAPYTLVDDYERWGFIAHELQETMLDSAAGGYKDCPGPPQQVNVVAVLAVLTKTLQEAMARIETLEAAFADT